MFSDKISFKIFSIFGIVIFVAVIVRLVDLQIIDGKKYVDFVNSQASSHLTVSENRGYIYDKDGNLLAGNKTTASLYTFRKNISSYNAFVRQLNKYGITLNKKTKDALTKKDTFTWVARQIDIDKADKMVKDIDGLEYFKEEARFYPQGTMLANVIGFTGVDNKGYAGMEYSLNKDLEGKQIYVESLRDSKGRLLIFENKSDMLRPDTEVYLTISSRIQSAAEYLLREGAKKFGAKNGSVVAMDIKTGEILLAASVKTFDPHNYSKYPKSSWKNHPFTYVYEPGSIFKTVAFSFLEENGNLNKNLQIDTNKKIKIGGYTYSDTKDYGVLKVDEIYKYSSNIGTAALIIKEKNVDFYNFLVKSGFGEKTGVYGVGEESGRLKHVSNWSKTSKSSIAIGYEVLVTPLQMARFYGAVANDGIMVNPKILTKIVKNGKVTHPEAKEERIMSSETASYILSLMQKTVEDGTGVNAKTQLTKVAGKTGTSSIYDNKLKAYSKKDYSASFAGVFPAENPKVAMVVVYESPTSSIYGGSTAANVFRQIAEFVSTELRYIEPSLRIAYAD